MKKLLPVVIIVAVLGAALWFFLGRGPKGETPSLAATMPAASTAGIAGVQGLDVLAKTLLDGIEKVPAEQRKAMGPVAGLADAAQRKALIGFDPASPEGWAEIGVDPAAGFGLAVDARLLRKKDPVPVLLFKLTDQAKLLAFIEAKAGVKPTIDESAAPAKLLKMGDKGVLYFGERQGYTAALMGPPRRVKDVLDGFKTYLGETGGDLAADAAFKRGFDGAAALQVFGYLNSRGVIGIIETLTASGLPKEIAEGGKYYAELFPGLGLWAGTGAAGGRLVASEKGIEIIRKMFAPASGPAKFSELVPAKGYSAFRVSVNLKDLFSGIGDAMPPSMAEAKSQIGMAPMALAFVGLNWEDIVASLTGHVVISVDVGASMAAQKDPNQAKVVILLGLNDTDKADALVPTLLGLAGKGGGMMGKPGEGPKPEAVEIDGAKGHKISVGPITLVAVRDGKVLVAGPEGAVKAALAAKKGEHLADKAGVAALDGDDVIQGVYYDAESLGAALAASGDPSAAVLTEALKGQMVAGALRHDSHGVYWKSEGMGVAAMVGVLAAVAVPAFTKYMERSKDAGRRAEEMHRKMEADMKALEAPADEAPPAAPVSAP